MLEGINDKLRPILDTVSNKKKTMLVSSFIVLAIIGAIFWFNTRATKTNGELARVASVKVKKGDVVEAVTATGTVQATTQVKLNFPDIDSNVTAVNVEIGQHVKKGETLAMLDDNSPKINLANAQANLESAKARLLETKQGATKEELAVQQTSVEKAYLSLQSSKMSYDYQKLIYNDRTEAYKQVLSAENQLEQARIQLESSQAGYLSAKAKHADSIEGPTDLELDAAEDAVDRAEESVDNAVYAFRYADTEIEVRNARLKVVQAEDELERAERELEELKSEPGDNTVTQADAALAQAQASSEQAQLSYNTALRNLELAKKEYSNRTEAKNQLEQAKLNYDQARVSYKAAVAQYNQQKAPSSIADVKSAQANVIQAQAEVDQQQLDLNNLILKSPINGVVAQVNVNVGEKPESPSIVINSDLNEIQVMAKISQIDISKIKQGQSAVITTSNSQDKKFSGKVLVIYPEAETSSSVTTYSVLISVVDNKDFLRPGMTTNVSIKTNVHKDTLYIPTTALKELDGKDGVYLIAKNGSLRFQPITIGLFASDKVEILSGLKEGDRAALRSPKEAINETSDAQGNSRSSNTQGNREGGMRIPGMGSGMGMGRR